MWTFPDSVHPHSVGHEVRDLMGSPLQMATPEVQGSVTLREEKVGKTFSMVYIKMSLQIS